MVDNSYIDDYEYIQYIDFSYYKCNKDDISCIVNSINDCKANNGKNYFLELRYLLLYFLYALIIY